MSNIVNNPNQQRFFIYARKSTDVEDKQVQSIEGQLDELRSLAKREGLTIVEELVEKQSAKIPGRPIFNNMISRIERGVVNTSLSNLKLISDALGVEIIELFKF
nr:recombinase family protein [uncultured Flavobacterium sp.]